MSVEHFSSVVTHDTITTAPPRDRLASGGLDDTPAGHTDRDMLLAHLGRETLHGSYTRNFASAYFKTKTGEVRPRLIRTDSEKLAKCEYVALASTQYAAVIVVDIDQPGTPGGHPSDLALPVRKKLLQLVDRGLGPSWVGINPLSGKAQAIWLIDPAYAGPEGKSPSMTLMKATSRSLGELLDHDPSFSHRFSRSPFYDGPSKSAYRWYRQHNRVFQLRDLRREVAMILGQELPTETAPTRPRTGREVIEAAKARRLEAQALKAMAQEVEADLGGRLDEFDTELIDGVRVRWIVEGSVAARDETAFRHALKTAHRLRNAGQRMKDTAIIDAYEHAYAVAQRVGAGGRDAELPPMRDRQTMARRVRGYVIQSKPAGGGSVATERASSPERKALATMGRRGGQTAAQRWKTDPDGEYATDLRRKLDQANSKRQMSASSARFSIASWFMGGRAETGCWPTIPEAMDEFNVSRDTVKRALKAAGIELPRGRRSTRN